MPAQDPGQAKPIQTLTNGWAPWPGSTRANGAPELGPTRTWESTYSAEPCRANPGAGHEVHIFLLFLLYLLINTSTY
jgi:hypothetical protein